MTDPTIESARPGPGLDRIRVPAYFGTNWRYTDLHLRGAFQGYQGT